MIASTVWTVIAAVGVLIQVAATADTRTDMAWLHAMGWNGAMSVMARLHRRTALLRLYVCVGNLTIGAISFTSWAHRPVFGYVVIGQLCISEALLVYLSYSDRRARATAARAGGHELPSATRWVIR